MVSFRRLMMLVFAAAFLSPIFGQEAKLMILDREDTTTLKTAYQEYKAAKLRWERAKNEIASKYTTDDAAAPCKVALAPDWKNRPQVRVFGSGHSMLSVAASDLKLADCRPLEGWEKVELSVDFRAIVPQQHYAWNGSLTSVTPLSLLSSSGTLLNSNGTIALTAGKEAMTTLTLPEPGSMTIKGAPDSPGTLSAGSGDDLVISTTPDAGKLDSQGGRAPQQ